MPRSEITHGIDVRRYAAQKRAALATHRTPVYGRGRAARLFRALVRSPLPVFRVLCGTEWFAEPGGRSGELVAGDQASPPRSPQLTAKPYNQLRPCRRRLPPQHRDIGYAVTVPRSAAAQGR